MNLMILTIYATFFKYKNIDIDVKDNEGKNACAYLQLL